MTTARWAAACRSASASLPQAIFKFAASRSFTFGLRLFTNTIRHAKAGFSRLLLPLPGVGRSHGHAIVIFGVEDVDRVGVDNRSFNDAAPLQNQTKLLSVRRDDTDNWIGRGRGRKRAPYPIAVLAFDLGRERQLG